MKRKTKVVAIPKVRDVRDITIKQLKDQVARCTRETIDLRDALDAKQMQMLSYATSNMELHPCAQCAALIVQAGIKRVVCEEIDLDNAPERWRSNMKIAQTILREGGVLLDTPKDC